MSRQGQHYHQGGGGNVYGEQMRQVSSQRMDHQPKSSGNYQRREGGLGSDRGREREYGNFRDDEHWRNERDGSNLSNRHLLNEVHRDGLDKPVHHDHHRSGFQSSFEDERRPPSHQPRQQDFDLPFVDDSMSISVESLGNKFLDEIMKLVEEQKDAEDAEYTRHKEKLDTINIQYQEQLTSLRANQASRREVLLQNESNVRQQQYQKAMADQYLNYSAPSNNPQSYYEASPQRGHRQQRNATVPTSNNSSKESYKYNQRDHHGAEPRNSYRSGRIYENNREFY